MSEFSDCPETNDTELVATQSAPTDKKTHWSQARLPCRNANTVHGKVNSRGVIKPISNQTQRSLINTIGGDTQDSRSHIKTEYALTN